jgi:tetratricopeptide (TPR) repeat protein
VEAELHLAVAQSADPADVRATVLAGRACLERRDFAGAHERFTQAAGRRERYADHWMWIGLVRLLARDLAAAIAAVERSLELNRCYSGAWQALALARFLAGDARGAALAVRQMTLRHRERPAFPGSFYRALAERPDDEAMRELRRAAAFHPEYTDIAGSLAEAERRLRRALRIDANGALKERAVMETLV